MTIIIIIIIYLWMFLVNKTHTIYLSVSLWRFWQGSQRDLGWAWDSSHPPRKQTQSNSSPVADSSNKYEYDDEDDDDSDADLSRSQ